jgi:pimeloyl-ACP methyl ester carboxylesterase
LAFYGHSFGGQTTSQVLAMEPRLAASVLYVVGMSGKREVFGEIEPTNYLPRVNMPVLMLNGEYDDSRTPARANAFFKLLGTPAKDKAHVLEKGGHFVPRDVLIRETLDWLDKYLGKPSA